MPKHSPTHAAHKQKVRDAALQQTTVAGRFAAVLRAMADNVEHCPEPPTSFADVAGMVGELLSESGEVYDLIVHGK